MRVLRQGGRLRRVVSTWCGGDQTLTEPGPAGQSLRVSHSRLQRHAAATGPGHLPSCQLEGEGGVISGRVREDSFEVESIDIFWCSLSQCVQAALETRFALHCLGKNGNEKL